MSQEGSDLLDIFWLLFVSRQKVTKGQACVVQQSIKEGAENIN
jgi:hypothetical protein